MQNNRENPMNMFSSFAGPYASMFEKYFSQMPMLKPENFFQIPDNDLIEKQLHMFIHNGHVTLEYFKEISLSMAKTFAPMQNQFRPKGSSNQRGSEERSATSMEEEFSSRKEKSKKASGKKSSVKKTASSKSAKVQSNKKSQFAKSGSNKPQATKQASKPQVSKPQISGKQGTDPFALGERVPGLQKLNANQARPATDKNKKTTF